MTSSTLPLPATAAHLRIHKSLDLHLFDSERRLIGTVPLRDKMVQIRYAIPDGQAPTYIVMDDAEMDTQTYHVRLPIELPFPDSEYFDDTQLSPTYNEWFFNMGFHKDISDERLSSLAGIGTVDIADISILPDPVSVARQGTKGCWICRIWRCLFPVKDVPTNHDLVGLPAHFPFCRSLLMLVNLQFQLSTETHEAGAQAIRMGIFVGQEAATTSERTFLLVCAPPSAVTFGAKIADLEA